MHHKNEELYRFLQSKTSQLTEDWYTALDKSDETGVYASTDPLVIDAVKKQNHNFHQHISRLFSEEESDFHLDIEPWINEIAQDAEHLNTPIHFIIRELMRVRDQYFGLLKEFAAEHKEKATLEDVTHWNRSINQTFDQVIILVSEAMQKASNQQLIAQQHMINELSSPIIALENNKALLPLVGDIDTSRAKLILENTLEQCAELGTNQLYIDLSGVVIIDTMVAHQIFQLIDALGLLGVECILSGIRPEIAMTAIQLGLSFEQITIRSTLSQALAKRA